MVTDDHSRGQVILIGAIALAFIILGIVVVFNGVLYSETISSSSTSQATSDADLTEHELETALIDMSDQQEEWTESEFETNVTEFVTLYQQTKATSRATSVDVALEEDDVIIGNGSELGEGTNDLEANSEESFNITYLEFGVKDAGNGIEIEANATDDTYDTNITIEGDGPPYELKDDHGNECTIHAQELWIDVKTGLTRTGEDCSDLTLIESEEYYYIEIKVNGSKGSYAYAHEDIGSGDVLAVDLEYTYESNDVSISDDRRIRIYGGES